MICPQCKAEYRENFTTCSDCGVPLVDRIISRSDHQDASAVDPDVKFVTLLETRELSDIVTIKAILDAAGVRYFIQGENMMYLRPVDAAVLKVEERDAEKARKLLRNARLSYLRMIFRKPEGE